MTRIWLWLLLSIGLGTLRAQDTKAPRLVVVVVVEHMRQDYLSRFEAKFGDRGFRRLLREGVQCSQTRYQHAFNHDATGYATLATGTHPSLHGIVGNTWYDRLRRKQVYCTDDAQARTLGAQNASGNMAPTSLLAGTLGDALKLATQGQSKVIGIAMKDCGAIFAAGRAANAAYWVDSKTGLWISSSYYMDFLPAWVNDFNARGSANTYLDRRWEPEYNLEYYTESLPDANDIETGFFGYKKAFPYYFDDLRKRTADYSLLPASPFGNTYTRDFAISTIINESLGKDKYPDLLWLGFSATGNLSRYFAPNSVETQDAFLKLDKDLAYLLDFLDQQVGPDQYLLVLTANTGAMHAQGYLKQMRQNQGLFNHRVALPLARSYLKAIYGPKAEWITHYEEQQFYFDQDAILKAGQPIAQVQEHLAAFLIGFEGVAGAYTGTTLNAGAITQPLAAAVQRSYNPRRSADVVLVLQPGWVQQDQSSDHNSPYASETQVPLIWWGQMLKPGTVHQAVAPTDIATTLAYWLQIAAPESAIGRIIDLPKH